MRPVRQFIRVHGALLCLSMVFCVVTLLGSGVIRREELPIATLIAFAFAEVSAAVARHFGPVLQQRTGANDDHRPIGWRIPRDKIATHTPPPAKKPDRQGAIDGLLRDIDSRNPRDRRPRVTALCANFLTTCLTRRSEAVLDETFGRSGDVDSMRNCADRTDASGIAGPACGAGGCGRAERALIGQE